MTQTANTKRKMGRPLKWNDDNIEDLASKLVEWAEKDNSFALIQFCKEQKMQPNRISKLCAVSEYFKSALMYAKSCLASRMIESLNSKNGKCHPVFFNKYIRINDFLLDEFMKAQEKSEKENDIKYLIKTINFAKQKDEDE